MLHGDVRINDTVIGTWTATRGNRKGDFRDYNCTLTYRGLDGYNYAAKWQMYGVGHMNGAISLAARVLQEGMRKAERVENTTLRDDALDAMSRALHG